MPEPVPTRRAAMLDVLRAHSEPWDFIVVGGGATGLGVAVDAASRGYAVALFEQADFGQGTSSRSTKLVHGGVRYLQQGNVKLVREALHERGLLLRNAPHLCQPIRFVLPTYAWWGKPYFGVGLKVYDLLAGGLSLGASRVMSKHAVLDALPTLRAEGLRGGVSYFDGQFDDARLIISLMRTAAEQGAVVLNHAPVVGLVHEDGRVRGVRVRDAIGGHELELRARVVVNATGAFTDAVRRMDDDNAPPMIAPSQGAHVVLDRAFLPTDDALIIPKTRDGRVLFAIPWHGKVVVGTTDTPVDSVALEPRALPEEIDFILETAAGYLTKTPTRSGVRSVFTGVRPLVKAGGETNTAKLSRDHVLVVSEAGLVTITGGKWTTYRRMAEDAVNRAAEVGGLMTNPCQTARLALQADGDSGDAPRLHDCFDYTEADVLRGVREELAQTVDDVLARRTRALFLDTEAALEAAPRVAELIAAELGHGPPWADQQVRKFAALAEAYRVM